MKYLWKVLIAMAVMLALVVVPATALAIVSSPPNAGVSMVDIGTPASETAPGIAIVGWGPIEPDTSGGNWGGIATDPLSTDKKCRVIWEAGSGELGRCATITYTYDECVVPTQLEWRALEGQADDSYTVKVDGILVYTYTDAQPIEDAEVWYVVNQALPQLSNSQTHIVEFCATGSAWEGQGTYGQVGFDWVNFTTEPCEGDSGNVELTATVIAGPCLCLTVSPPSLSFGSVAQGSVSGTQVITLTNCGDVPIVVTADAHGTFYEDCLELSASAWGDADGWVSPEIPVGGHLDVNARVNVPIGYPLGTYTELVGVSFVASVAP